MKKAIIVIAILIQSCSSGKDFEKGKQQLVQQGYTDIENTGHSYLCCSKDDSYSTGFAARDAKGNTVKGCFCSGIYKGVTIRFE